MHGEYEMSKKDESKHRARYTLEFKLEAVRLVKGGQEASVTARVLGVPKQTLSNWVRLADKGELQGAGERPVSAEQMELGRLRAELARVKMERDILKNATAYFAKDSL
jgi:transposase-like protein